MSNPQQTHQVIEVKLHDGASIEVECHGQGPALLMCVNPHPIEGEQADALREFGVDPALGRNLIDGLKDRFRVIAFDYEGHVLSYHKPHTLTPDNIAADFLAVADAAQAERFAYYGYSWLAVVGLQLVLRTDRLLGLAMGGYPPLDGPYDEMFGVTTRTYEMALRPEAQGISEDNKWDAPVTMPPTQAQQFVTLYEALRGFDDRAIQSRLTCPRLCFAGSADAIQYGERWGNLRVDIAGPIMRNKAELEHLGWEVHVLEGLDHIQAMQVSNVLPILRPWLISALKA